MSLIVQENFDSGSSIPASFNVNTMSGSAVVLNTNPSNSLSSPNSLQCTITSAGPETVTTIYSTKPDHSNGNCTVSASFMFPTTVGAVDWIGVVLGVGQNTNLFLGASDNSYMFSIWNQAGVPFEFGRVNNGAGTAVAGSTGTTSFTAGTWYTMTLTRNGNSFWASCSYTSAGTTFWALPTGGWQANTFVNVFNNYTDVAPLASTTTYGGVSVRYASNITVYVDDLSFRDLILKYPAGPLKGMHIGFNANATYVPNLPGEPWTDIVFNGFAASFFKQQLDLSKTVGCNAIRAGSGLVGVAAGSYTMGQYQLAISQVVNYCKSRGLWYFHSEDPSGCPTGTTQAVLFPALASYRQSIAQTLSAYPNVVGFDMMNEFLQVGQLNPWASAAFPMTAASWDALFQQMIVACRVSAPNLPLTACQSSFSMGNASFNMSASSYQFDWIEFHIYTFAPTAGQSAAVYTAVHGTVGKPFYVGEFGGFIGSSAPTRLQVLQGVWSNVVQATYPGQPGCIGAGWFCALYDSENSGGGSATGFQMWNDTAGGPPFTILADVGPAFSALTVPSYSFGSNFRRRRR